MPCSQGLTPTRPNEPRVRVGALAAGAVALAAVAAPSPAAAQQQLSGTPYIAFVEDNATYVPLSGGNQAVSTTSYFQNYRGDVALPFPFRFYGNTTSEVRLNANGAMYFDQSGFTTQYFPTASRPLGNTRAPNQFIAPLWTYLEFGSASDGIYTDIVGRAPTRQFVAEWRNARGGIRDQGGGTFKVVLHEGLGGRIDISYDTITNTGYSFYFMIGMEDVNGGSPVAFANPNLTNSGPCRGNFNDCSLSNYTGLSGKNITLVQDPGVELVGTGVEVPQFATLGVPFDLPVTFANAHRNPLGPFDVRVLASRNRDGSNAVELGRISTALGPFQVSSTNIEVNPVISLGENSYFLFLEVDADNVVAEVDEVNNLVRGDQQVRFLPSRPDLDIAAVRLSSRAVNAGDSFDVFVDVVNSGSEPLSATEVAVMLSSNPVISANDGQLGTTNVNLDPGQSATATVTVTIPAQTNSGGYFIGALGDPQDLVAEISESNNGLAAFRQLEVSGGDIAILTEQLPQAVVQETYTALLRATGGSGDYEWTVSDGRLPQGIGVVPSSGEFFGRPNEEGSEMFTIQVTDANDPSLTATQVLSLDVITLTEPLTIVTRDLPAAIVGQEYDFELRATGGTEGADISWSMTNAPEGLELTTGGMLMGTVDAEGDYDLAVEATNGEETAQRTLTLSVQANGNLQILTEPLPVGQVGQPYDYQFTSNGGIEPITWLLVELRNIGLDLDQDGRLTGTPDQAGRFRLEVEARDAGPPGFAARDRNIYELVIEDDNALQITTESLPPGNVGAGYDRAVAAIGGLPEYSWTWEGRVPTGLVFAEDPNTNELRIGGVPEEETTVNLLVTATDREGRTARRAFVLDIGPEIVVVEEIEDEGCTATSTDGSPAGAAVLLGLFGLVLVARRRRA